MDPFEGGPSRTEFLSQQQARPRKTKSRILDYSVGDIRYCFSFLRNCKNLTVNTTLWTGITAGQFAVQYLLTSNILKK